MFLLLHNPDDFGGFLFCTFQDFSISLINGLIISCFCRILKSSDVLDLTTLEVIVSTNSHFIYLTTSDVLVSTTAEVPSFAGSGRLWTFFDFAQSKTSVVPCFKHLRRACAFENSRRLQNVLLLKNPDKFRRIFFCTIPTSSEYFAFALFEILQ